VQYVAPPLLTSARRNAAKTWRSFRKWLHAEAVTFTEPAIATKQVTIVTEAIMVLLCGIETVLASHPGTASGRDRYG
jgi:hypothetical protein